MIDSTTGLQRKLKTAAYLLIAGLAVEGATLQWAHPVSFMIFILLGSLLVVAGLAVYLLAIVSR